MARLGSTDLADVNACWAEQNAKASVWAKRRANGEAGVEESGETVEQANWFAGRINGPTKIRLGIF